MVPGPHTVVQVDVSPGAHSSAAVKPEHPASTVMAMMATRTRTDLDGMEPPRA
jgi:hypothetical protein